ncbi:MAG: hypothetical protein Q9184_004940 [Pyrenodesmia sp. 2 TL-2023]
MTKSEVRWRIGFRPDQYKNVLVTEQLRHNEDLLDRPISVIEVAFDVLHPPMSTDISIQGLRITSELPHYLPVIRFLQGFEISEKPPAASEAAWEDITTGTLYDFVTSGLDHAGMVLDGDYFQLPK